MVMARMPFAGNNLYAALEQPGLVENNTVLDVDTALNVNVCLSLWKVLVSGPTRTPVALKILDDNVSGI